MVNNKSRFNTFTEIIVLIPFLQSHLGVYYVINFV